MVTYLSEGFHFHGRLKNPPNVEISDIIWMCGRKPLILGNGVGTDHWNCWWQAWLWSNSMHLVGQHAIQLGQWVESHMVRLDALTMIYSWLDTPVCTMCLTGGSDTFLAAQQGNTSTLSIEIFTILTTPEDDWWTFWQQVVDHWTLYKSPSTSEYINAKAYWAKQWWDLEVRGRLIKEYLKDEAYKMPFAEFCRAMEGIVVKRGGTVEEARSRFRNDLLKRLIWN